MKKVISTKNAPAAIGPYSQGTVHNNTLYISGQLPIDPATGKIVEGSITNQTNQALENLRAIVEEAGTTLDNMLKVTILLTSMADFQEVNTAYSNYFINNPPARICYQVSALPLGAQVEIDGVCAC